MRLRGEITLDRLLVDMSGHIDAGGVRSVLFLRIYAVFRSLGIRSRIYDMCFEDLDLVSRSNSTVPVCRTKAPEGSASTSLPLPTIARRVGAPALPALLTDHSSRCPPVPCAGQPSYLPVRDQRSCVSDRGMAWELR